MVGHIMQGIFYSFNIDYKSNHMPIALHPSFLLLHNLLLQYILWFFNIFTSDIFILLINTFKKDSRHSFF